MRTQNNLLSTSDEKDGQAALSQFSKGQKIYNTLQNLDEALLFSPARTESSEAFLLEELKESDQQVQMRTRVSQATT